MNFALTLTPQSLKALSLMKNAILSFIGFGLISVAMITVTGNYSY
ncbi:hypothetical protein QE357_003967 [Siphonobacter sp. BAB-5404]|nr:hypothetical protein [Siphonobacter sp. SORGH_AS_0500]